MCPYYLDGDQIEPCSTTRSGDTQLTCGLESAREIPSRAYLRDGDVATVQFSRTAESARVGLTNAVSHNSTACSRAAARRDVALARPGSVDIPSDMADRHAGPRLGAP